LGKIKWASVSTAAGFTVIIIVFSIFQDIQIGERFRIVEELSFIREDLDENERQYDSITNETSVKLIILLSNLLLNNE
jgi:hypothetical protein